MADVQPVPVRVVRGTETGRRPVNMSPPPLHNLLVCANPSAYGLAWWLCPPECPYRAWGEAHSPHRPPERETES